MDNKALVTQLDLLQQDFTGMVFVPELTLRNGNYHLFGVFSDPRKLVEVITQKEQHTMRWEVSIEKSIRRIMIYGYRDHHTTVSWRIHGWQLDDYEERFKDSLSYNFELT